jgi:uroporphyrinogen III methyltransferase/synthase
VTPRVVPASRPLAGRRIVVTRAASQASTFRRLLEEAGAEVIEAPMIAIEPPPTWALLDDAIRRLPEFAWVVFTSVNGVEMFERRLAHQGLDWTALSRCRVAAIGPATGAALGARGVRTEAVPDEYRAEGLVARLAPHVRPGDQVLLPRAAETRDVLVRGLAALGARVAEVPAYLTRPLAESASRVRAALERDEVDVVTFTSSSTARNFAALFTEEERARLLSRVAIASIGPVTAETAAAFGLTTRIMPRQYTIPALTDAIAGYLATLPERS